MVHLLVRLGCACLDCDFWQYHFCDGLYDDEIYMADSGAGSGRCSFSADVRLSAVMPILDCGDVFFSSSDIILDPYFFFKYMVAAAPFEIRRIVNGGK